MLAWGMQDISFCLRSGGLKITSIPLSVFNFSEMPINRCPVRKWFNDAANDQWANRASSEHCMTGLRCTKFTTLGTALFHNQAKCLLYNSGVVCFVAHIWTSVTDR